MTSLSDRVEAATGADRELDAEIRKAAGLTDVPFRAALWPSDGCWVRQVGGMTIDIDPQASGLSSADFYLPRYTASLDAAMTLVPEDCLAMMRELWFDDGKKCGHATVSRYRDHKWDDTYTATADMPALALTAASLRARGL